MAEKVAKEQSVVATFEVTFADGSKEEVSTNQKAWVVTNERYPASAKFVGWKRKD